MASSTDYHWMAIKRLLRYLSGISTYILLMTKCYSLELIAYSYVDWEGSSDDQKSTNTFCIFHGDNFVSWKSSKQKVASRSSTESEYPTLSNIAFELLWFKSLLTELYIVCSYIPVFFYNMSTQHIAHRSDEGLYVGKVGSGGECVTS